MTNPGIVQFRFNGHTEFDLGEVARVSIVSLHLIVENESRNAGTTQVELRFPEPFVIIELPTVERWTASAVQGSVGAEVIGVLWVRPTDHGLTRRTRAYP